MAKRGSSEQVWLRVLSPGAEMGALGPVWMAHHCQVSLVSKDKAKLALDEGGERVKAHQLCGTMWDKENCRWVSSLP